MDCRVAFRRHHRCEIKRTLSPDCVGNRLTVITRKRLWGYLSLSVYTYTSEMGFIHQRFFFNDTGVKRWLAAHPRYQVHYTPTYASWLNQVEIWFNIITQRAIRRGTFRSVKDLIAKIEQFVSHYNRNSHPFIWAATADSILEKVRRLCKLISETGH